MTPLEFATRRKIAAQALKSFAEDEEAAAIAQIALLTAEGPVEEPEPPVEEPQPEPEPTPDPGPPPPPPPPPPATPNPPASTYDEIVALSALNNDDWQDWPSIDAGYQLPPGFQVTADTVTNVGYSGDLLNVNIGDRAFICATDMGGCIIRARPKASPQFIFTVKPGASVEEIGGIFDGQFGSNKAINGEWGQGKLGSIGAIRGAAFVNLGYDVVKGAGSDRGLCVIEGNYIAPPVYLGGAPHFDGFTIKGAYKGMKIARNMIDMRVLAGAKGVNNVFQFAPHWAGTIYGDIDIEENVILQGNPNAFAMMKTSKYAATWGKIRINRNWWDKAGDIRNVFYGKHNFADEFNGNIDLATGQVFTV